MKKLKIAKRISIIVCAQFFLSLQAPVFVANAATQNSATKKATSVQPAIAPRAKASAKPATQQPPQSLVTSKALSPVTPAASTAKKTTASVPAKASTKPSTTAAQQQTAAAAQAASKAVQQAVTNNNAAASKNVSQAKNPVNAANQLAVDPNQQGSFDGLKTDKDIISANLFQTYTFKRLVSTMLESGKSDYPGQYQWHTYYGMSDVIYGPVQYTASDGTKIGSFYRGQAGYEVGFFVREGFFIGNNIPFQFESRFDNGDAMQPIALRLNQNVFNNGVYLKTCEAMWSYGGAGSWNCVAPYVKNPAPSPSPSANPNPSPSSTPSGGPSSSPSANPQPSPTASSLPPPHRPSPTRF